ncbi:unnamed protein product [Calypogeia fissa]
MLHCVLDDMSSELHKSQPPDDPEAVDWDLLGSTTTAQQRVVRGRRSLWTHWLDAVENLLTYICRISHTRKQSRAPMSMTLDAVDDGGRYRGIADGQVFYLGPYLLATYTTLPAHPGGVHSGSVGPFVLLLVGGVGPMALATSRAGAGQANKCGRGSMGPRGLGESREQRGGGGLEQSPCVVRDYYSYLTVLHRGSSSWLFFFCSSSARGSVALVVALSFAFDLSVGRSVALVQMLMMHTVAADEVLLVGSDGDGVGVLLLVVLFTTVTRHSLFLAGGAGWLAVKQSATVILLGGGGTREEEVGTEHGARDGFNADFSILFSPAGWHTEFCDCPSTTGASSVRQIVVCTRVGVIRE